MPSSNLHPRRRSGSLLLKPIPSATKSSAQKFPKGVLLVGPPGTGKTLLARAADFAGADLANLINEAALLTGRGHAQEITQRHFQDAFEKVVAGPERESRRLGEAEKRRVAYHEVGHGLVASLYRASRPCEYDEHRPSAPGGP